MMVIPGGADIQQVQARDHGLVGVAEVRSPEGGDWHPMLVRSGSVTLAEIGALPARTANVSVLSATDTNDDVTDWLTPFGSWVRLWHKVIRVGGTVIMAPLGYFRVDTMAIQPLDGTIDITASDAGALVLDYALPTLAAGQVTTAQTYLSRLTTMLSDVLAGIPPWWTIPVDAGPASTTAIPKARLQYTEDRLSAVTDLATRLGVKITTPADGSAVFRLATARDDTDASDITVRPGQLGNMVETGSTINRDGIANTAIVLYTREIKAAGARTRIEQRRLVEAYADPDGDTAAGGPFGTVTIEVDSTNVDTDAEAATAADTVLKQSLNQVRDVATDTTPIYGLEPGDIIRLEDSQGIATKGILVSADMGLTAADDWGLTVRTFVPVGKWSGPRRTVLTDAYEVRDDSDWKDYPSKAVDLTGKTPRGWSAHGGTVKDGGSQLLFTSNGAAGGGIHTTSTWTVPGQRRVRVRFTVKSAGQALQARAYVDPNASGPVYGPYVTIAAGKSKTVSADLDLGAGTTFIIGLSVNRSTGTAMANGTQLRVSNVGVESAVRKT